jgi:iron complex outermembrane receptor protein
MTIQRSLASAGGSILLCVLFTLTAFSQTRSITGKVTDDKGAPLQGATVAAKGTKTGVSTGADGTFSITVSENVTTLTVSSIGYTTQDVPITGQTAVSILLVPGTQGLNEVVVIGYGTVRKKDATGSLVSVKAKDFNQGVITSPDQLLQGKVSGLEIVNNSGQPGSATTIKIRGNNSIRTANNPLYVVDGVALDGRTARPNLDLGQGGLGFGPTPESNPLLYINPNDISQIDVLKDASATAIYGSRGANGIIVITTKKGVSGPTKLEFGTSLGAFAGYMKNYGLLSAGEFRAQSKANNLVQDSGASVNALKEITQHTLTQNYNLAFSGGNDRGKFRASFLGSRTAGFLKKTNLDKYLGNFGGSYNFIDKRITFDFGIIAGHTRENMGLISNTTGAGGNVLSWALNWNPTRLFRERNGLWANNPAEDFSIPNPMAAIDAFTDFADVDVVLANISATVKILDNLEYKFLYAINHGAGTRKTSIGGWLGGVDGLSGKGFGALSEAGLTSQTFTHTLNYHTDLAEALRFEAIAGYEYWKTDYYTQTLGATGFNTNLDQALQTSIPYYNFMQNASTQLPLSRSVDPRAEIQSYFARVNFNLSDKYYLTATMRADGSNKFGKNNKYGYFPSVGAKWAISNEDFMKGGGFFSNLGLRGSWGITGNQEFPSGASLEQFSSTAFNAAGQTNVANPDLKWEKTTTLNFGFDYAVLGNKLYGSFDWYHKKTTDLLFQNSAIQPAPASIYFINLPADLINKGVEFSIGTTIISKQDFTWDLSFNIAYNKNKLTHFNQARIQTGKVSGNGVSGVLAEAIADNQPVDVFYLKKFSGFDQNGQQIVADTASYMGDPNPSVISGLSTTLKYKKISLVLNLGGSFGNKVYNNTLNTVTNIYPFSKGQNVAKSVFGKGEALSSAAIASSRYLESGNFVKLRNATLNYAFGDVGKYIHSLNVYLSGTNLFVITKFKGFDPEVNIDTNNNAYPSRSMEYLPYPTPRVITLGLNLGL